jgi:urease accessory protein
MLVLTKRLVTDADTIPDLILPLSAEERTRSRYRLTAPDGLDISLLLPRGTVLQEGDLLTTDDQNPIVAIAARSEPVITVTAKESLDLLRAAYHLGNRHVKLEVTTTYLRLYPDPVLKSMLIRLGLEVKEEIAPFLPEFGAYGHHS